MLNELSSFKLILSHDSLQLSGFAAHNGVLTRGKHFKCHFGKFAFQMQLLEICISNATSGNLNFKFHFGKFAYKMQLLEICISHATFGNLHFKCNLFTYEQS